MRTTNDGLAKEYRFDYRRAKPNRFASKNVGLPLVVMVDHDLAQVFDSPEAVNRALRALVKAVPSHRKRSAASR
jgi:hypothetical protein